MHFQIFIPGSTVASKTVLANVGLDNLAADCFKKFEPSGPEGMQGTLFGWRPFKGRLYHQYTPNEQTWRPCAAWGGMDAGRYWVGTKTDDPPKPDDLQRAFPYRCVLQKLGDGREWWFPAERKLPKDIRLGDDGDWYLVPLRIFDEFCQACRTLRELLEIAPESRRDILFSELVEFARSGLSVNYRTCPEVESDLGLWRTDIFNADEYEPLILNMIRKAAPDVEEC